VRRYRFKSIVAHQHDRLQAVLLELLGQQRGVRRTGHHREFRGELRALRQQLVDPGGRGKRENLELLGVARNDVERAHTDRTGRSEHRNALSSG